MTSSGGYRGEDLPEAETRDKTLLRQEYEKLRNHHGQRVRERTDLDWDSEIERIFTSELKDEVPCSGQDLSRKEIEELVRETDPANPTFQPMIDKFSRELEAQIPKLKGNFEENIFAAEWITGDFNACAMRAHNGLLLLVNKGLMDLTHQVVMLLGYRVRFSEDDDEILEPKRAVTILFDTVLSYLMRGQSVAAERVPAIYGNKGAMLAGIRRECERFVLAHEYGHAIAGHLSKDDADSYRNEVAGLSFIKKNWKQEFEADLCGMKLLLSEEEEYDPDDTMFRLSIREKIAGAFLFFSIGDLLTRTYAELRKLDHRLFFSDTHPPLAARAKRLREYLLTLYHEKHVENSLFWSRLLADAVDIVVEELRAEESQRTFLRRVTHG